MEQVKKMTQENLKERRAVEYFESLKSEFRKIAWTTKDELFFYTKLVMGASFIAGFAIYGVDLLIQGFLKVLSISVL